MNVCECCVYVRVCVCAERWTIVKNTYVCVMTEGVKPSRKSKARKTLRAGESNCLPTLVLHHKDLPISHV